MKLGGSEKCVHISIAKYKHRYTVRRGKFHLQPKRESQLGKQCLNSLEGYLASIKKWLTFGKNYNPLKDSSDLDFDQVDVNSVPEIMQVQNIIACCKMYFHHHIQEN